MSNVVIVEPSRWIVHTCLYLLAAVINGLLLHYAWTKRNKQNVKFISVSMQIYPLLSLLAGFLRDIFGSLMFIPLFCYFSQAFTYFVSIMQLIFMGYFQLARLKYCFSNSQIHSKKGYPQCVFIVMYTVPIPIMIYLLAFMWFDFVKLKCKWDVNFNYTETYWRYLKNDPFRIALPGVIIYVWDIITLILYVTKTISFRFNKKEMIEKQMHVWKRIKFILNRVILLTLCYWIYNIFLVIFAMQSSILSGGDAPNYLSFVWFLIISSFHSICINCCVFLMEEHNSSEYARFLRILNKYKFYYICFPCCCLYCNSLITQSLNAIDEELIDVELYLNKSQNDQNDDLDTQNNNTNSTMYNTTDYSIKNEHSNYIVSNQTRTNNNNLS
eukprot:263579_1